MKLVIDNIDVRRSDRLIQLAKELQATYEVIDSTEEEEDAIMLAYLKQAKDDELASKEEAAAFINSLG